MPEASFDGQEEGQAKPLDMVVVELQVLQHSEALQALNPPNVVVAQIQAPQGSKFMQAFDLLDLIEAKQKSLELGHRT